MHVCPKYLEHDMFRLHTLDLGITARISGYFVLPGGPSEWCPADFVTYLG